MAIYKRGKVYWYKFVWNGEQIRTSTKQGNQRVAEQIEAARKTQLAKGEVGIKDRKPVPTLVEFVSRDFRPYVDATFEAKPKTLSYYVNGLKRLLEFEKLASERIDQITSEKIAAYISRRKLAGLKISSINRELQVLRRLLAMALEWGKLDKVPPRVKMLPGEKHRERVITAEEEAVYLTAARSEVMTKHVDPELLSDVAMILFDCGLRPEECFRLRHENVIGSAVEIHFGKTDSARRRIPMTARVEEVLRRRVSQVGSRSVWVFPAPTRSGHIEPSSLKKQHANAVKEATRALRAAEGPEASFTTFDLYTLRHTCLTRWAPHMDPWTLAYLAGHTDMSITKRYVHPQEGPIREAMERVRGGHKSGHSGKNREIP
jgi:integrase